MSGPLEGLKVIEMAGLGPCPLAGQLLADLGADVTVIERAPGADRRQTSITETSAVWLSISKLPELRISCLSSLLKQTY